LKEFYDSLEGGLMGKDDEMIMSMGKLFSLVMEEDRMEECEMEEADIVGTSLRELIHKFRHRTLIVLKMLMLQKRVSYVFLIISKRKEFS
jgi:hypothetical protein